MAFVEDDDTESQASQVDEAQGDEDKKKNDPTVSLGDGGSGVASPGGGNVGGNNVPTGSQQGSGQNASGSWTNLQDYLDANKDQAAQVGNDIASTVGGQAKKSQDEINSAGTDFSNQVDANTVKEDDGTINNAITGATSLKSGDTFDPNLVTGFQNQLNATYNGPTDFTQSSGYTQAQNDFNTAKTQLDQTKSEAGRDVLLNNQYSGASQNGYNQGEKTLDQALIEGSPDAQSAIQGVQNQWGGIQNTLANQTTAQNAYAASAQATDTATAAAAKAALDNANTGFQGGLNTTYQDALTRQQEQLAAEQKALATNNWTPEQLAAAGLTLGQHTYGMDLNNPNYIDQGTAPTLYNSATADQYAQANALAQLAGQTDSTYLPSSYASQVGTAMGPTFNARAIQSDLDIAKASLPSLASQYFHDAGGQPTLLGPGQIIPDGENNLLLPYNYQDENAVTRNYNSILNGTPMTGPFDPNLNPGLSLNNALANAPLANPNRSITESEWQHIQDVLNSHVGQLNRSFHSR